MYALTAGHKVGRSFRLMVHKSLADDVLMNLRSDNEATIAMLDNPSWRTRYLSIYGETIRQEVKLENAILTYVDTNQPSASRCAHKAYISSRERQNLPTLGLDPQEWMSCIAETARMQSRHRGDRVNCRTVSAIWAQLRAILMYIATGCTSLVQLLAVLALCLGCLRCLGHLMVRSVYQPQAGSID